jgi:hypothetical protein
MYWYTLLTYPRSWVLLEEPLIGQPLKSFPAFHGTRRFNTVFTTAFHGSLSWALSIQSNPIHTIPSYLSKIHFDIVHPPTSWSSQWSLSFWLSNQYSICTPLHPYSCYMARPSHPSWLDYSHYTWRRVQVTKLLIMQFSPTSCLRPPVSSSLFGPNILLNTLFSNTLSLCSSLNVRDQVSHPHTTTEKIIVFFIF